VLRFTANPYDRHRDQGLPRIQEIVFERRPPNEAKELMLQGKIHLIYDVRMRHVVELREGGVYVLPLRTPSVWFLAPNYRRGSLANRDLRLAITHAIDRDAILDQQFRRGGNRQDHVVLTGPYPADSWAYNHRLDRLIPTDATEKEAEKRMARACAQRALKGRRISLRLAYPQGNPEVQEACTQIKSQVEGTIEGITMVLEAIEPGRFHDRIVNDHDFDLAYWRQDYESPTFWLEPLLDQDLAAQRPGGPNFMGYTQDQVVAGLFRKLNMHKHFPDIQGLTHEIHEHVARNAVVIPLWQLDTYVALSPRLRLKDARGNVVERNRLDLFGNLDLLADARCWELAARGSR
jgi:ABC-type oligopeptide transport system substrate-binding subunit